MPDPATAAVILTEADRLEKLIALIRGVQRPCCKKSMSRRAATAESSRILRAHGPPLRPLLSQPAYGDNVAARLRSAGLCYLQPLRGR